MHNKPTPPRVLLADDNVDAAQLTCELLEIHGIDAHCVFSGVDALASVPLLCPDVVVLDIGMPHLDGHATFRGIRALPKGSRVPVIALTAYGDSEESSKIRATGFAAHLVKPCEIAVLLSTIYRLAGSGDTRDSAQRSRTDTLTAQRIEVALVYQKMLGTADAEAYLSSFGVPVALAHRVLHSPAVRSAPSQRR